MSLYRLIINQRQSEFRMLAKFDNWIRSFLSLGSGAELEFLRPQLNEKKQSSIEGVYVIGDLAGAPVIKLAMADGYNVIEEIVSKGDAKLEKEDVYDVFIVGAGAAGLNAALAAQEHGLKNIVVEKGAVANTIENFPEGKWVYAEPDDTPPKGKLWLDGGTKENLIERWKQIVSENSLDVRAEEALTGLTKNAEGIFEITTTRGEYRAGKVVLATGQRGNPRKLGVSGEEREEVYHRLYSPKKYKDEGIIVVGGGNSAIEAAITLSEQNRVFLSYRKGEFSRIFKDNRQLLEKAVAEDRIEILYNSQVKEFGEGEARLEIEENGNKEEKTLSYNHAFVLIGAELPIKFLKSLGLRLENEWTGSIWTSLVLTVGALGGLFYFGGKSDTTSLVWLGIAAAFLTGLVVTGSRGNRFSWLGISFIIWHTIYGAKLGSGQEFWPYKGWGYDALSFFDRPWSFWYTVMYTTLMTVFGFAALKRWGISRQDSFQIWRFISLISFQWIMFFLVPEYLFQSAVEHQWVGEKLANDPTFADQAWRSYGIIYAWPLFFYTFFYDPHQIWVIWGVLLSFVMIPIFVLFFGKRYCSWICGCGGLAETFGDRWRHLAPKGKNSVRWEWMGIVVLAIAVVVTLAMLFKDVYGFLREPADYGIWIYRIIIDVWLVGILPVTLYPFFGGKVWCRYWCPLAKMMQLFSKFFAKKKISHFSIEANDKCIGCGECSRYCQVGINVMSYALKQEAFDNEQTSCIGCGICVTVCPMDTLTFGDGTYGRSRLSVVQ